MENLKILSYNIWSTQYIHKSLNRNTCKNIRGKCEYIGDKRFDSTLCQYLVGENCIIERSNARIKRYKAIIKYIEKQNIDIALLQEVEPYFINLLMANNKYGFTVADDCINKYYKIDNTWNKSKKLKGKGTTTCVIWRKEKFTMDKSYDICNNNKNIYRGKSAAIVELTLKSNNKKFIISSFHLPGSNNENTNKFALNLIRDLGNKINKIINITHDKFAYAIIGGDANSSHFSEYLEQAKLNDWNIFRKTDKQPTVCDFDYAVNHANKSKRIDWIAGKSIADNAALINYTVPSNICKSSKNKKGYAESKKMYLDFQTKKYKIPSDHLPTLIKLSI